VRNAACAIALGCCGLLAAAEPPPRLDLRALEQEMARHPAEAISIARRATEDLSPRSENFQKVFAKAAEIQEGRLTALSEAQVIELANLRQQTLADAAGARRVRQDWLQSRERALADNDAPGRVALARLWLRWLDEREAAARLCQQALRLDPDLTAAQRLLLDDLGYRQVGKEWVTGPGAGNPGRIRPGMTAAEVRASLGQPHRIARQILFRRYLEQWTFEGPTRMVLEFDCLKGQEPRVLTVHAPTARP
jgi:hypothetical protein